MVQQVLQRFGFTYSSPQATPLSTRHSLSALPSDESVELSGPYPELVGCLMYLMTCTRPDLAYPLSILARCVAPGRHRPEHMAAAKRVLRYLCSTSGMGLVLGGRRPVVLTGHADASWADDQATQRSSQCYTFSLGSGSVSWRSTRSSSVLSSSCEAEIYAGAMAAQELRWLTYLLTDLGEQPRSPPVLYVDNKAMLALCREHRLEHRTKHLALRYFLACELQQRGQLRLAYVASEANTADIFTKELAPGDHQHFCTMLAYVKSELQKRHTCTDLGELRSYLGLHITRDRARRTITLTQSHMVQQVLQRFGFTYSSPQATPLSTRHSLSALPSDESVELSGPYPELVGCLMYLMTCTRPDLAYPLSILARCVAPGRHRPEHMAAAKRVLRYLCSTSGMGLVLGGRRPVVLTGHADASWADDQATQRSSQCYTFSLGSGSVSWRSTRSSSVLSSSCEAEIYAGAMAAQELRWLTYLLTDLGEQPRSPPVLYVDNKAMLALCREHRLEHRTKHLALRYFLACELQQRGQLRLAYVASEANTADIFTKELAPGDHQHFCTMLGTRPREVRAAEETHVHRPGSFSASASPTPRHSPLLCLPVTRSQLHLSDESVEPSGSYPKLVGCLMYVMTCTRPDLAYPLSLLARYVAPGRHRKVHWDAAKRVLRYLCSTSGMGLVLGGRARVVLTGHADTSWVDDLATQRSSQGYTFSLGSGSVSWRSTRSSSVLSSICEAEIYAGAMAALELRWLTYLLTDLGEAPRSPPVLYINNKAMLALCHEHRVEHRTKHIALRYFLARELQQHGQLRLAYMASWANTADVFTQALQPCDHQHFCTVLGLACYCSRALLTTRPPARARPATCVRMLPSRPCCPRTPAARVCLQRVRPCCPRAPAARVRLLPARPAARAPCCLRALASCARLLPTHMLLACPCCPRAPFSRPLSCPRDLLPARPATRATCCLHAPVARVPCCPAHPCCPREPAARAPYCPRAPCCLRAPAVRAPLLAARPCFPRALPPARPAAYAPLLSTRACCSRAPCCLRAPAASAPLLPACSPAPCAPAALLPMVTPLVLAFDAEGCPIEFESWHEDLHLYLQSVPRDNISLFVYASGSLQAPATPAEPVADAGTEVQQQYPADLVACTRWTSSDATARLAVRTSPPLD
ncbi:unnamed protein product [Closterium sp. NIES-54]